MEEDQNKSQENDFQEMQALEQRLQNILNQKQSFQIELSEAQSALQELEGSGDEVFKLVGQLLVKSDKSKVQEELKEKEKFIDIRMKSIENQENSLMDRLEELRKKFLSQNKK